MEIESEQSNNNEEEIDMQPLSLKTDKKLVLTHEAESVASSIASRRLKTNQLNRALDPNNYAQKSYFTVKTKQYGNFEHFLTKNKHRQERTEVLEVMRELAESKDHVLSGRVSDKLERSKMILRVVSKEDSTLVMIQDETGKEKMMIKSGTVWVGMISLMEVSWSDNCYKLEAVYDLGTRVDSSKSITNEPNSAYRMLFVKGALMKNQSKDNIGLKVIINELRCLKEKERERVSCLVIMGPLLNSQNIVLKGFMESTFEEEAVEQIKLIRDELSKNFDEIDLVFMPSTDDLSTYYPIPQPKFSYSQDFKQKNNIHFTSNPGFIQLFGRENVKIDMINLDLLNYIDENRAGRASIEIMQENIQTYFKQPFYLTNAMDQPFDQTNLPAVYNAGHFGDIVVTSSRKSPPFAREVKGRVFINIGALGIDEENFSQKHFMTLVSIYEGSGPLGPRTKVESIESTKI